MKYVLYKTEPYKNTNKNYHAGYSRYHCETLSRCMVFNSKNDARSYIKLSIRTQSMYTIIAVTEAELFKAKLANQ